jgi:hypothetical protein
MESYSFAYLYFISGIYPVLACFARAVWTDRCFDRKNALQEACMPITVAARSKAWTIFARSSTGVVGSNPARGMCVCIRLFCVCVVLCVGNGLATGWSPFQGVLPTVYRNNKLKNFQGPKGCRAIEREREKRHACCVEYLEYVRRKEQARWQDIADVIKRGRV